MSLVIYLLIALGMITSNETIGLMPWYQHFLCFFPLYVLIIRASEAFVEKYALKITR